MKAMASRLLAAQASEALMHRLIQLERKVQQHAWRACEIPAECGNHIDVIGGFSHEKNQTGKLSLRCGGICM
jgi:hypothetical protein